MEILDPDKPIEIEERFPFVSWVLEKGERMWNNWIGLSTEPIPEDNLGKVDYGIRMITQVGLSKLTESAGMAAFLLEEAVQAIGMGAFLLYQAQDFETLDTYLDNYNNVLSSAEDGVVGLAAINPLIGGVVMMYLNAARHGYDGLRSAVDYKLVEQAEKDEALRKKLLDAATLGTLRLSSVPSSAEIWINNENTELITPETFKNIDIGAYDITLRKYNSTREEWDIFSFTINLEAGRKKEIHVRIPPTVTSEEEEAEKATYGRLMLKSRPTSAEIHLNGVNTGLLTPETFKEMTPGTHEIKLRAFSRRLNVWDEYTFSIPIEKGKKTEVIVNIPGKAFDKIIEGLETDTDEEPQLGEFVKAEVTGEYAIDGDTFITTTGERIRILAIDAPEIGRPWADVSKESLSMEVEDKKVYLRIQSHKPLDMHGRTLAICRNYKGDIAVHQLSSGLARVAEFEDDLFDYGKYYSAEQVAKDRGIGIWS